MKKVLLLSILFIIVVSGLFALNKRSQDQQQQTVVNTPAPTVSLQVTPITHASLILQSGETVIYADPTGGAAAYAGQPAPTMVVVTDIHGDHLNADTIAAVIGEATLIVPQAVKDQLPTELAARAVVMANGDVIEQQGSTLTAIPMYNLPEASDSRHVKGRGNGYVIEKDGLRMYIAGDTAGTPEMRALKDIDIAFIPMNPPFTMTVEEAADAVLAFQPAQVYPYHYRGQDGLSDVSKFKELVNAGNPNIDVVLLDWYPE